MWLNVLRKVAQEVEFLICQLSVEGVGWMCYAHIANIALFNFDDSVSWTLLCSALWAAGMCCTVCVLNCPRPELFIGSVSSSSLIYFPIPSYILLLIFCVFVIGEKLKISVGNQTAGLLKLPILSF